MSVPPIDQDQVVEAGSDPSRRQGKFSGSYAALLIVVAAITAGLLAYSQTLAHHGDEGFHLLAAQLILAGKRPYLEFFYQHVPLYAYLNAGWSHLFGDSWRSAHTFSALLTAWSVLLVAVFVYARVCEPKWRLAAALTAALLMGLHALVIQFGTIGQPYGLCLVLLVGAFWLVIGSVARESGWRPLAAGLCAGAAAASSLLAAPVVPILLTWLVRQSGSTHRLSHSAWFVAGVLAPFLPLLWLAVQAPRQTLFNVVQYHLFYRRGPLTVPVTEAVLADMKTLYSVWLESTQGLLLVLLAVVGILFLVGRSGWEAPRQKEAALCAWLAGRLGICLAGTWPTFPQYFILVIPFVSILASIGVYAIGSRICSSCRPGWLVLLVVGLFAVGLAKQGYRTYELYQMRQAFQSAWWSFDAVAREVNRVTPNDGEVWVESDCAECIYVAAKRVPPPGMENSNAYFLELPAALAASLKIMPRSEQEEWLAAGRFATVVIEDNDPRIEAFGLGRLYAGHTTVHGYHIFWDRVSGKG